MSGALAPRRKGLASALVYAVLRGAAWAVALLPFRALAWLGRALGALAGGLLRIRRAHVRAAMARAGVASPDAAASAMYRALGTSVFEFLWLAGRGPGAAHAIATVDRASREALARARRGGRGVVLAASHTGNWDLAACAIAGAGELLVVTKRLSLAGVDAFWQETRAGAGVRLVEARGALASARATLARGGAVAMMIDQVPSDARHAVRAPFLGADAWVDRSPATLAAHAGVPLVVCASRREAGGGHTMSVLAVLEPPSLARCVSDASRPAGLQARRRGKRDWAAEATLRATVALDAFVRANPSEWLWMHRRWKAPRLSRGGHLAMSIPCPTRTTPPTISTIPSCSQAEASRAASS